MSELKNKIDFVALVSVTNANGNGDPLSGNCPRTDNYGYGEISDVCIKRKIRNRMQDLGHSIFVQSQDRTDDKYTNLSDRAKNALETLKGNEKQTVKEACEKWMDVRAFGQLFAFKGGVSIGIRGPVSVHQAVSISPVEIEHMQITKSVNSEPGEKKSSETMGTKHFVRFGLYKIKGAINVELAKKTDFSEEDAAVLKECLRTLFVNDASAARPDGSMEVVKLYWWEHNCKDGQYSSAVVHRSVHVEQKNPNELPRSVEDYVITVDALDGLVPEIIDGL